MMLARLMDTQIWHPPAHVLWVNESLNKGTMASASISIWNKVASSALSLNPDNSVPSHMSLVPFKLLPQCWSLEQVKLSVSKYTCWDSSSSSFHSATISIGFHSQKLWELIFPALEPWAGELGIGLGPFTSQGGSL